MPDKGQQMKEGRISLGEALGLARKGREQVNLTEREKLMSGARRSAKIEDEGFVTTMTYGDEFVAALDQFIDAKLAYGEVRRGRQPNNDEAERVEFTATRLRNLIDRRR